MSDYNIFLAGLEVYPSLSQIFTAANYAQEVTTGYVRKIDANAVVIVDDGEVDINSTSDFSDLHFNAQCIFDTAFQEAIIKFQSKSKRGFESLGQIQQEELIYNDGNFIKTQLAGEYLCDIYLYSNFYVVFYYLCDNYDRIKSRCFSNPEMADVFIKSLGEA